MKLLSRTIYQPASGWILLPALFAAMTGTAAGQHIGFAERECSLRGEIAGIQTSDAARLMVEIRGARSMRVPVSATGSFEVFGLPQGQYEVLVTNVRGTVLARAFVALPMAAGPFTVRLPAVKRERPPAGTISVQRLQHQVPKAARKEFEKAAKAIKKNDSARAVQHLQKAVAIDPEYMEAHNNLGARYLALGRAEEALQCFEQAMKLDPGAPEPPTNASIALLRMKRFEEAEKAAARALDLNPASPLANLVRGMALTAQNKASAEAVRYLNRAADRFPAARLTAAQLLAVAGDAQKARQEVERYLASGDQEYRGAAESLLAALQPGQ